MIIHCAVRRPDSHAYGCVETTIKHMYRLTERTHSHLWIGKWKKTERANGRELREGYEKTEFGQDAAISVEEEAIFVQSYKSCARDLDFEHILDACSPGRPSCARLVAIDHLCRSRRDLRKTFRDGRTDGQTDRRRTPHHCISSWNELKMRLLGNYISI